MPRGAVHEHEEAAEAFTIVSFVVLALSVAGAFLPGRLGSAGRGLFLVGTLVAGSAGLRVGHLGGQLVYVHGAASAHVQKAAPAGQGTTAPASPAVGQDDDDR